MMQEGLAGGRTATWRPSGAWPRWLSGRFRRHFIRDECQVGSPALDSFFPERDQVFRQRNFRAARVGLQQTAQLIPGTGLPRRRIRQHFGDDLGGLQAYPPRPAVLRLVDQGVRGRVSV
jgi:hypothetical protein